MSQLGLLLTGNSTNTNATVPSWQDQFAGQNQRDLNIQVAISVVFGLSAFISFCVLRPKWTELYNARKKQSDAASRLPELPKTMFGWIPVLYNISEEEVLASAGLDAFAFLSFFRYAIKFLTVSLFFSVTVLLPVNYRYTGDFPLRHPDEDEKMPKVTSHPGISWTHAFFTYFYTAVALYLLVRETKKIIRIRQAYLGTLATVTDRTIRLSGIPADMRSEESIKAFIEELQIGKVSGVMLCRDWSELDDLMDQRMNCLRKLEEAWSKHLGGKSTPRQPKRTQGANGPDDREQQHTALLSDSEMGRPHITEYKNDRPQHTIRYGRFKMKSKKVDAIDYWEEKLRVFDEKITDVRKKRFRPTPLAFVTMESTAACQMAVQAMLDPTPGQLIATHAPPPADVVWRNTYLSRNHRMVRSWSIMVLIGFLTIFWAVLLIPLAALLSISAIDRVLPGVADALDRHPIAMTLVQSGLPTLVFTLLSVAIPYLYDWLANMQGMTSQSDVELSVISKNYFFTFFNLFIIFTVFGSASNFLDYWEDLKKLLRDTTIIASAVAKSLEALSPFYTNLIILQALGLFPFRLLEFGAVSLYPFYLITAKTPRDHAELTRPPVFSYGFYLPQSMLIFVICVLYSVLPKSSLITVFGLIYFCIGGFVYKYQLLYAMDHRQHSTGRGWPQICNRIIVGLVVFQIAMSGILALRRDFTASLALAPLLVATIWYSIYFARTYHPLMHFIALRSVDRLVTPPEIPTPPESSWDRDTDRGRSVDTDPETGLRYINPNLVAPLETLWIRKSGRTGPIPRNL